MGSLNPGRLCGSRLEAVCVEEPGFLTGSVFGALVRLGSSEVEQHGLLSTGKACESQGKGAVKTQPKLLGCLLTALTLNGLATMDRLGPLLVTQVSD